MALSGLGLFEPNFGWEEVVAGVLEVVWLLERRRNLVNET